MPTYFQKPENALKRAKEFIEVDKKDSALQVLNDVIRSKKHRTWTMTHESIMKLFTELCVDLQRSSFAKDGLYQYRNICKDASLKSFETVVKAFLGLAESKANAAREESEHAVLQEVEDLDVIQTPEGLLLSTVSGEGAKERTDRVLLTPWVKFLWESYRNMLELLKNNQTIERLYADVAKDAFQFCLNYQRRTEFRKLCDILRNHLTQAQRYQNQTYSLNFENLDTVSCLVDVRFEQLECSITVDLWQEAFKAIEEIHNLLNISKKAPKPGLLENFYTKQARVYWMASNHLFHAAALHKLFVLRKEQKKTLTPEEAQRTASQVLLATLSIPIEPIPSETDRFLEVNDTSRDKAKRLSSLLRMATPPSRASLLKDVVRHSVLQYVPEELQQLYEYLEVEFNPLILCKRVIPILEGLEGNETLAQYVEPVKEITIIRLIKQVSQVYESIELTRLVELAPFTTPTQLEKVVVETAHSNGIQVRIDHRTKSLRFGTDMTFSYLDETPEGPYVQSMPAKGLCGQLTLMSQALQQAVRIISNKDIQVEQSKTYRKVLVEYHQHARQDHKSVLSRKQLIEARKEFIESKSKAKEHKEEQVRREREKQERKAEAERLAKEAKEREEERVRKEIEEMNRKRKQEKLDALKKTAVGARALEDITAEDLEEMDTDDIMAKQLKQMEKEMKDKEGKLKAQEKKHDYFIRAKRIAEIPLLENQYQEQIKEDRRFHEQQEEERIARGIKERKDAESAHSRMKCMGEDKKEFLQHIKEARHEKYLEKLSEFEEKLEKVKAERLEKRRQERKEKRKVEAAFAKSAEEEKLAKQKLEEERTQREEERKKREAEFEVTRQKQEQREREIEEKMRKREEEQQRRLLEERERGEREMAGPREREKRPEPENWRQREAPEEEERYPPSRGPPERRDEYPPSRGGAYRPPGRRLGEDSWRAKDDEADRRGPPPREEYDSPRQERESGGWRDRGRDERDRGREDAWRDRGRDERDRGREDAWRDRGREDAWRDRGRDERDRGREDAWRDRGREDAWRDRGREDAWRDRGREDAWRDRGRDDALGRERRDGGWGRAGEAPEEEERYPPRRGPPERRDEYPPSRGGAYRPPGRRLGEDSWRAKDDEADRRGPPPREEYDSPRGMRRDRESGGWRERGREDAWGRDRDRGRDDGRERDRGRDEDRERDRGREDAWRDRRGDAWGRESDRGRDDGRGRERRGDDGRERDRGRDDGWRRERRDDGWRSERDRGSDWRGRGRESSPPPSKKPEKEVDDEGFEVVARRR